MSRHEPLTPEERELAQHLAHPGHAGPSPATDARILAAARLAAASDADAGADAAPRAPAATPPQAALSPATTTRHRRRRHWPASLGLAASVALAVGVAWQLREPPQPLATTDAVMAPSPVFEADPSAAAAEPQLRSEDASPQAGPTTATQPASAAMPPDMGARATHRDAADARDDRAATTGTAVPAQATKPRATARASESRMDHFKAPPPLPALPALAPPPPPPPPAPAAPMEPAARAMAPPSAAADPQVHADAPGAAAMPPPPPSVQASETEWATSPPAQVADTDQASRSRLQDAGAQAAADHDAEQWLQRIRQQRERGDLDGARASLARFVRSHPGYPLPQDLRALLPAPSGEGS